MEDPAQKNSVTDFTLLVNHEIILHFISLFNVFTFSASNMRSSHPEQRLKVILTTSSCVRDG